MTITTDIDTAEPAVERSCVQGTTYGAPGATVSYLPDDVAQALSRVAVPVSRMQQRQREGRHPDGAPWSAPGAIPRFQVIPREPVDAQVAVLAQELAGRVTGELPDVWAGDELTLVGDIERIRAWLDLLSVGAIARFHAAVRAAAEAQWDSASFAGSDPLWDAEQEADATAGDELALATGWCASRAQQTTAFATCTDGRTRRMLVHLQEGVTTLERCLRIFTDASRCHPDDVLVITDRVLAPMPDGSTPSDAVFRRRLRKQIRLFLPDPAAARADAISRRTAFGELHDDGTGTLTVTGETTRVVAALDRVEAIARSLRGSGDGRTLTQLRSDVTLDLLLVGWPIAPAGGSESAPTAARSSAAGSASSGPAAAGPAAAGPAAAGPAAAGPAAAGSNDVGSTAAGSAAAGRPADGRPADGRPGPGPVGPDSADPDPAGPGPADPDPPAPDPYDLVALEPWFTVAIAPAATVHVVVPLATLLGLDEGLGEIPGHGFLTSTEVRQIAMATGSVWRRLVTDPLTGCALDLSTRRYRPTRRMADLVAALDGVCRAPGCTVPAASCDIDHAIPWPRGETTIANLGAKHRRHHNHKTRGLWQAVTDTDGTTTWHTVSGRTYVTHRYRYHDPTDRLPETEELDRSATVTPDPPF